MKRRIHTVERGMISGLILLLVGTSSLFPHHFKGLPHYNYFENYPQAPQEEFLGQAGDYECSLVVYDFQGINREKVEAPENTRLFLVIFNLLKNTVYKGPLTLEILDRGKVYYTESMPSSELENLYSLSTDLPESGKYSLRITLREENDLQCVIPFTLSAQKIHWSKWVSLGLVLLITVSAFGARKARVAKDRKFEAKQKARQKKKAPPVVDASL